MVQTVKALEVGRLASELGAGRTRREDPIDLAAGITLMVRPGDRVNPGHGLAVLQTQSAKPEGGAA